MPDYKIGEVVDITIKGVRINEVDQHGCISIVAKDCFDGQPASWRLPPQAAVTRIAPAEWPPEPGDLWREENNGGLWFVFRDPTGSDRAPSGMRAREADGDRWTDDALNILDNGPLTLVFRDRERCPF